MLNDLGERLSKKNSIRIPNKTIYELLIINYRYAITRGRTSIYNFLIMCKDLLPAIDKNAEESVKWGVTTATQILEEWAQDSKEHAISPVHMTAWKEVIDYLISYLEDNRNCPIDN